MTSLPTALRRCRHVALALLVATSAAAQSRDSIAIVSVSPPGNLKPGVPTDFVFIADVTLASGDSAWAALGFNQDDPHRYRMMATEVIRRGTQRVTLHAMAVPVDWSTKSGRFAYMINIRLFEPPAPDGRSRAFATVRGEFGDPPASSLSPTYFEFQVEQAARALPGSSAPQYPPALRKAGIEGEVLAQFVVDTLGSPLMNSFKVLKASAPEFVEAVRAAVAITQFAPAELGGRKVRQLVQQPFVFNISRK